MDDDAMDYEMQRHDPHPHVGPRLGGGCPALAGWRGEQYRSPWQAHRGWSPQYFPPVSSDAFLYTNHHPHTPSFLQHWPQGGAINNAANNAANNASNTTPHLGLPAASRPPDSNHDGSFNHQIPEFSPLPPIPAQQPYSPVTFVPPPPRPAQRNPQIPQGPGDFQHILHSNQASPNPATEPFDGGAPRSELQPASRPPQPPASATPSEPGNAASGHDNDGGMSARQSHNPLPRAGGHGPPPRHPDVNVQPHARPPPPASNLRPLPPDAVSRRSSAAAYSSRESFASPASASVGLRSRSGVISTEGSNDAPASPGSSLDDDDDSDPDENGPRFHYAGLRSVRQAQLLRGQMSNKRVASQRAIKALQNVDIEGLPENERTCVICYNDFGVLSPEGVTEHPLRLPKCKHVFGNHCILKWFGDADSCPYCRDKLHSEPAPPSRELLRRTYQVARVDAELGVPTYRRVTQSLRRDTPAVDMYHQYAMHSHGSQPPAEVSHREASVGGERRALPEDPSDTQRRQRPRHDPSRALDQRHGGLLLTGAVSEQRFDPSNTASQQHSPVRQPFSPTQSYSPAQRHHLPHLWPHRTLNAPNFQQSIFPRRPNIPHQPHNPIHPTALAPLGPASSGFSSYVPPSPPTNGSSTGYLAPLPHGYSGPLGGSGLQALSSAELPLPTPFPGSPHAAFAQQPPQVQFRSSAYAPFNHGAGYGRPGHGVSMENNSFYPPN
ncbi:hypothetical protein KVR01_010879 [Diaporthe batatas]|uniref:uncharacterized protein n=1 Tax=Diaporthe batatas TaxID=748121 RepID=UPI001D03BEEE|nr:uncharacterized protein KVR01_010879 [Diaporthe batatas]KAG8159218.1 hypothetical protein KVR01_010879 [Diaporthe batatas]